MKKRYYLAYGSNLNISQMGYRCPQAKIVGTAVIKDYRLMFKGSQTGSYLTIEPEKGMEVPVAVWEVTPDDEARLDRYEGYPRFYYKKEMTLEVTGIRGGRAKKRKAFVYIMHEDRSLGVPSRFYIETCREGYEDFGFDENILADAYDYSKKGAKMRWWK